MKRKRFLCALLAAVLLLSLVPASPAARADSSWSAVYERFILNQEYLSSGLSFHSDAYIEPRFGLYDLDRDGTPELLAFNGGPSLAQGTDYVFVCENGSARYVGNVGFRGSAPYYYESTAYPGLFCTDGNMGEYQTVYYELRGGAIVSERVMTSDEIASWSGHPTQITADDALFALSRSGADAVRSLPFYSYEEIRSMGWQSFVGAAAGADSGWSAAYERFVLQGGYLDRALSFMKISHDAGPEPRFALHDFDRDGTPQLIVEGGPYEQALRCYVFTCRNGHVQYDGEMGPDPYFYRGSAYPGLFSCEKMASEYQVGYFDFSDGKLLSHGVSTYSYSDSGTKLSRPLTLDEDLYAWSEGGQPTYLPFYSLSEIRAMGWQRFVQTAFDTLDKAVAGTVVAMSDAQQYAANIFLSNFSEQHAFESAGFAVGNWKIDDLVSFAYLYCKINRHSALGVAHDENGSYYTVSLEDANAIWSRHFGFTLSDMEAATYPQTLPDINSHYRTFYASGTFYFTAADGESYSRFTVVRQMEDLGDGTYRLFFDIYKLDLDEYWKSNGVDSGFYALTASAAQQDSRLTWDASGVAVVRPYTNNGNATYQLVRYRVGNSQSLPVPSIPDNVSVIRSALADGSVTVRLKRGTYEYPCRFGSELFAEGASKSNNDLAIFSALLSQAVYHDEGTTPISELFTQLGIYSDSFFDNSVARDVSRRFAIAEKPMMIDGELCLLLMIVVRGTVTDDEKLGDHYTQAHSDFEGSGGKHYTAYDLIDELRSDVMDQLDVFVREHPELTTEKVKVLITGHSLGGATANLIGAQFNRAVANGGWYNVHSKEDVYVYTFAAIDSVITGRHVAEGYENIHNIFNIYDSFGPYGWVFTRAAGNSGHGKFGHADLFGSDRDQGGLTTTENHMLWTYLDALYQGKVIYEPDPDKCAAFRCPVDINVYREDQLVAQVVADSVRDEVTSIPAAVVGSEKFFFLPDNGAYRFEVIPTDYGTMRCEILDADTGSETKSFTDVKLEPGRKLYTEISASAPSSNTRLFILDSGGTPVGEIQTDGTEIAVQASGLFGLPAESARWLIVALAALLVALVCLVILLATRGRKQSRSRSSAPSRRTPAEAVLPAFSETRCCVCGQRLSEKPRIFFRTRDGREARLDAACYQRIYTLRKGEDPAQIREARRYIRSRFEAVDPLVAGQLRKCVEAADEYLSEL